MKNFAEFLRRYRLQTLLTALTVCSALFIAHLALYGQSKADFPDGFDAVQAAPKSHRVVFENALIRVLEVSVVAGETVPMHHHRWPSLLVSWDTGGKSPHVHYHKADGSVTDMPSIEEPVHPGGWEVHWMKPEPMHSVEVLDAPVSNSDLRIEIKCRP
ncbi:MAG TPA: hypothetical protein VFC10_18405 [Terriglobia bacterium]|jgi:hypothetical protein|nr:hypothetical protein [Terriglobia bacterium]